MSEEYQPRRLSRIKLMPGNNRKALPGDEATCRICDKIFVIPVNDEMRDAYRVLKSIGIDPEIHFGMINVCPDCDKELGKWGERTNADGKKIPVPPISPMELKKKLMNKNRTKYRKPFWCPAGYLDTENNKLPYQGAFKKVMAWKYQPKGLVFEGPTGGGKTRSAWCLLARLHSEGYSIIDIDAGKMANMAAEKFRDGDGHYWVEKLVLVDVLFIDDLGNESNGERGEGTLFTVIKRRIEANRPVIITTQKVGKQFYDKARNKERALALIRRLKINCETIPFR